MKLCNTSNMKIANCIVSLHCLLLLLYNFFCNGWPAKMGLVPFRQPSTLFCCCHWVLHIFCCIVENKPSFFLKLMGTLGNLCYVQYRNCCCSWHISRQKVRPWFWCLKVIQGQIWRCQSKALGPTYKCSRGPTSYLSPFSRYFESKFWRWPFDLGRANPWAKVH